MARRIRFLLPNVPAHMIQRGNDRSCLFPDDAHRELYLGLLGELAPRAGCSIHAYVLMTNHVHLLTTPREKAGIPWLMKQLGQRYVQSLNRKHRHTGSRLDGRYFANMVDEDRYFLVCQRYIELNPVRAGMVVHPRAHRWSSYHANALGQASLIVKPSENYLTLGSTEEDRCRVYARLVDAGVDSEDIYAIREAVHTGRPLGAEEFIAEVERRMGRSVRPGQVGRPGKKQKQRDDADGQQSLEIGV